jgi:two-component system cell cycle sensor histidine kinase/response regulator CckA
MIAQPYEHAARLAGAQDAVVATDSNFVLTYWNPAAETLYGWKAEEAVGRSAREVFLSEFVGHELAEVMQALAKTGYFHGEVHQRRKNGETIHVETRTLSLKDSGGRVTSA